MESLLPILVLIVAFYFLVLRPVRTRQREALAIRTALAPGQDVLTASGQYASVVALEDDDIVVLEVAPGLHTRWAKGAVARILTPEPLADTAVDDTASTPDSEESPTRG